MEPVVLADGEGEVYDAGGLWLRMLAQSPDQALAIMDSIVPPGFPGPVRHRHAHMTDVFYVLEGELAIELDGEWHALGPGSFVLVPPGIPHTFANRGTVPARVLNIQQPPGNEQYLKEAVKRMAEGQPWSPAEMAKVAAQYDFEPAPSE